jgi:hypothetical protein
MSFGVWSLIVTANGMERLLTFDSKRVLYFFLRGGDELWIVQRSKMIPARGKTKNEREKNLHQKGWMDVIATAWVIDEVLWIVNSDERKKEPGQVLLAE